MLRSWKRFDSILNRQVDSPDLKNTEIIVKDKELEKELISVNEIKELIQQSNGVRTLSNFF